MQNYKKNINITTIINLKKDNFNSDKIKKENNFNRYLSPSHLSKPNAWKGPLKFFLSTHPIWR